MDGNIWVCEEGLMTKILFTLLSFKKFIYLLTVSSFISHKLRQKIAKSICLSSSSPWVFKSSTRKNLNSGSGNFSFLAKSIAPF